MLFRSSLLIIILQAVLDGEEEIRQWLDYGEVPWKEVSILSFTLPVLLDMLPFK